MTGRSKITSALAENWMKRIAIDIGNVLTAESPKHPRLFASPNHLEIRHSEEAFRVVEKIADQFTPNACFLISRCDKENEPKIMDWLDQHRFFYRTPFRKENVRFCRKRKDKKDIAGSLRITHFIDDRWTVLKHIESLPHLQNAFLINPKSDELAAWRSSNSKKTIHCADWHDLLKKIDVRQPPTQLP